MGSLNEPPKLNAGVRWGRRVRRIQMLPSNLFELIFPIDSRFHYHRVVFRIWWDTRHLGFGRRRTAWLFPCKWPNHHGTNSGSIRKKPCPFNTIYVCAVCVYVHLKAYRHTWSAYAHLITILLYGTIAIAEYIFV